MELFTSGSRDPVAKGILFVVCMRLCLTDRGSVRPQHTHTKAMRVAFGHTQHSVRNVMSQSSAFLYQRHPDGCHVSVLLSTMLMVLFLLLGDYFFPPLHSRNNTISGQNHVRWHINPTTSVTHFSELEVDRLWFFSADNNYWRTNKSRCRFLCV